MTHSDIAGALGMSSLFCRLDEQGRNAHAALCMPTGMDNRGSFRAILAMTCSWS
jgi:hypothetical protein